MQFLLIFRQSGDVLFFLYARRLRGYTATELLNIHASINCEHTSSNETHPSRPVQEKNRLWQLGSQGIGFLEHYQQFCSGYALSRLVHCARDYCVTLHLSKSAVFKILLSASTRDRRVSSRLSPQIGV